MTGVPNPFEITLPMGEVVMPTPGLQDSDDDFVSVSELRPVHYINLEDDSADVVDDSEAYVAEDSEESGFEAAERDFEENIAKRSAARDEVAAQSGVAEGWMEASASMLDAQKALQAAEKSYKKLQHEFAGQAKHTVET
ncbi:hypothetical protein WJX74_004582 [Apatococcus lobatus]|uniref:Uncharacterized protein n=1 Tax=Apatococcus lobatus TaxID=904363 RepID=A0AAW1Q9H8_9CHLO